MEILYSVGGLLLGSLLTYLLTYKGRKPRLSMEVTFGSCGSLQKHVYNMIKDNEDDEHFNPRISVYIYRLIWDVKLAVRNSGDFDAHSVELFFHDTSRVLQFHPGINHLVPILKNGEVNLQAKYYLSEAKKPQERSTASEMIPHVFKDLKLMLKYKDKFGVVNYTKYDFSTKKNRYRILFRFGKFRSKNLGQIPEGFIS